MTDSFFVDGAEKAEAPFVYKISGLDDVVLLNGFKIEETDYGRGVSIENIDQLHEAIAFHIITDRKSLSPKEFLFLRREMGLTQEALGRDLRVDGQTVARYEKGQTPIAGPADKLIRILYVIQRAPEDVVKELTRHIEEALEHDEVLRGKPTTFRETQGHWEEVRC